MRENVPDGAVPMTILDVFLVSSCNYTNAAEQFQEGPLVPTKAILPSFHTQSTKQDYTIARNTSQICSSTAVLCIYSVRVVVPDASRLVFLESAQVGSLWDCHEPNT